MFCSVCKSFHDTSKEKESCALLNQSDPITNSFPKVVDLVIRDLQDRAEKGYVTYGTYLQPFNGRDALLDAYAEALDFIKYFRQYIEEENVKGVVPALNLTPAGHKTTADKENSKKNPNNAFKAQ